MWEHCFPLSAAEAPPQLLQGKAPKGPNHTGTAFPESIRGFPAWGRCAGDPQQGDVRDIPITGEMCRSFTPNETQGVLKCSEEMVCSKSKHRNRAGLQKMRLSNKIPQLLLELSGGSSGTEAAAKPQCQELPLLPQTFTIALPTARCHLLSCILWMRSQECRGGTFWCSERPAKPGGSNRLL